jgi:hypothetical protein
LVHAINEARGSYNDRCGEFPQKVTEDVNFQSQPLASVKIDGKRPPLKKALETFWLYF